MLTRRSSLKNVGEVVVAGDQHVPLWLKWEGGLAHLAYRWPPYSQVGIEFTLKHQGAWAGMVAAISVVDIPPVMTGGRVKVSPEAMVVVGLPTMDLSPWSLDSHDLPTEAPEVNGTVYMMTEGDSLSFVFTPGVVVSWNVYDEVRFGFDVEERLVCVELPWSMVPEASVLRTELHALHGTELRD